MRFLIILFLLCIGCAADKAAEPKFDLVIRGGQVLDGSGKPAVAADVGIRDGKVAIVGAIAAGAGQREIDAKGLTVAPGFIDVHTHADDDVVTMPLAENFIRDGVTTIVNGNCGGSVRDVGDYFNRVKDK